MAQVHYYVMYRPMHPKSNKPIIYTEDLYTQYFDLYMEAHGGAPNLPAQNAQNAAVIHGADVVGNPLYNALFVYTGVEKHVKDQFGALAYVANETFQKFKGDVWVSHSVRYSLQEAIEIAKPLISDLGAANVKIFKSAEMEVTVGLSK